jgi:D-alanine-D-alanine ligase
MKVCVLQPSYDGSAVDYANYDPPRDLAPLLPGNLVEHVFLKKATTFRQIKATRQQNFDIYVNLCEGYLEWDIPSIDVIRALEHFGLPYTGPTPALYDPSKDLMKLVASSVGVDTPRFVLAQSEADIERAAATLPFPLFVKPADAGDSLGIDADACVDSTASLRRTARRVLAEYDRILIEEFVPGREFTVLLAAPVDGRAEPIAYRPLEFIFPAQQRFKSYAVKVQQYRPEANQPCTDPELTQRLQDLARAVFRGFEGVGYARIDTRLGADDRLYFLEINFACSVFYPPGYEGSADYILKHDGTGQAGFLQHIIAEGQARHQRRRKKYRTGPVDGSGFGCFATVELAPGELIYEGEGKSCRIITRRQVEDTWDPASQEVFRRYAYPLGEDVYALWSDEPAEWAPWNHACDPNTEYVGLNVYARHTIAVGEELTLDYQTFCGPDMKPFECRCGAPTCRGLIRGNSASARRFRIPFAPVGKK